MFWNRKTTNSRHRQEYVLDVKLHHDQARANFFRFASKALTFIVVVAVVLLVIWRGGEYVLNKLIFSNPSFAVQAIDVTTDGALAPDAIRRWTGVKPGDNLMALDLRRVKRDLELQPFVQGVAVERVLPHTLRLRVTEREPVAVIYEMRAKQAGQGFEPVPLFLDTMGFVFPVAPRFLTIEPQAQLVGALPVITGAVGLQLSPGRPAFAPHVQCALRLLALFDNSDMAAVTDIRQVDLSAPEILRVVTGQGSRVTFATSLPPDMQLRRWRTIFELGQRNSKAIASLDLSITNNLPALWVEAGHVPAGSSKAAKPPRTKKKNV
ncbi:MAG: FtsQ-type POTRA domain-containing protein [Verrucomicrobia bacterium]|nr:FtsQ-type POTRA domain-containing protein [Verrucomicrobiota bacterium]